MAIHLVVADDHPVSRAGVSTLLTGTEIEIVCEATNGEEAVKCTSTCDANVVLLDVRMPEKDGFWALEQIKGRCPDLSVLMFSVSEDLGEMTRARRIGASGYLCKGIRHEDFLQAIRKAAAGRPAWTRQQLRRLCTTSAQEAMTRQPSCLTAREQQVLGMLVRGMINDEIAEELSMNVETVKQHVKHILTKLGVEDRTQAAVLAVRQGWA